MVEPHRTAFQEAADLPALTRIERFRRLQFRPPKPDPIASQVAGDPQTFQPTSEGSGIFGEWIVDDAGLPAYRYDLDQYADPRAAYPNTENLDRRDHWHQVGNQRITALASNDGIVQVYMGDRGGVFLNRFEAYVTPGFNLKTLLAKLLLWIVTKWVNWTRPKPASTAPSLTAEAQGLTEVQQQANGGASNPRSTPSLEVLDMIAGTGSPDGSISAQAASSLNQLQQQALAQPRDLQATRNNYAGGFSFIEDGKQTWSTAYRYRPDGAQTRRLFGMGYYETEMTYRNIRVTRRVYAPYGDVPTLLVDVRIENLGRTPRRPEPLRILGCERPPVETGMAA